MIPAIIYARASTDHQEYSVNDQLKSIKEWAKNHGYVIVKIYADDGISGAYAAKRPGFLSMIEDVTSGSSGAKALLIWDSYRFARNMVEFLTYKQMIRQHGVSVIAVSEPIVEDEGAQLYIDAINGASGELYLRKLSKDSKRGIRAKVIERHEHLGFAPFGYRLNRNTRLLEIVEEEAKWVRYIFQAVADGVPYLQICDVLNDAGVKTRRGSKWSNTQLMYALTNKTYCGLLEVTLDGKHGVYEGAHQAIISRELFNLVQEIIAQRAAKRKPYARSTNKYVHWLSGLMRCPYCGGALSYGRGCGGRADRYRCNSRVNGQGCKNLSVKVDVAASYVLEQLQKIYDVPEILCTLKTVTPKPANQIDYDAEIKKLRSQLTRAKKAYMEEIDTLDEYRESKTRITAAIDVLEEKKKSSGIIQFDPKGFQEKCLSALSVLRSDTDMETKVSVAHDLIEKIECDNINKVLTIYFYS
jgi:DNA invertase Pin-like site-specific DNA recombinase